MRLNAGPQEAPRRGAPHTASGIARHNLFLNEILNEKVLPFSFTIEEVGAFTLPDRKHNATEIAPLCEGLKQLRLDTDRMVQCFEHYLALEGVAIGRAAAEQRLLERLERG